MFYMRLAIEKLGYSSHPWRLVDLDGEADYSGPQQVVATVRFEHPMLGSTSIEEAISGNTKAECVQKVLNLLGRMIELRRQEVANG